MDDISQQIRDDNILEEIKEINSRIDGLYDLIKDIKKPLDLEHRVSKAVEVLDKFEDYMKNVDRLNLMVNELKGQVALVRSWSNSMGRRDKNINHIISLISKLCKESDD